ncbi:MAG: hypothetical protein K2X66_06645, partial [Cyanobacteria bacterium]|nr:hypothetical protein [Cyanobacteriota bacterium]
ASLYLCLLWALQIANHTQRLSQKTFNRFQKELETVPQQLETLLKPQFLKRLQTFTQKLVEVNHFILLSKGPLSLILPEIGLKLTETSSNIVYTDNTESFKHGPKVILSGVNGVHPNTVYLIPTDIESAEILFKDIRSHFWPPSDGESHHPPTYGSDRVFFVMFENSPSIPKELLKDLNISSEQNILKLPAVSTLIGSLFMGIVAFQLISYYLAETKGENPDNPMLEKAVVLE